MYVSEEVIVSAKDFWTFISFERKEKRDRRNDLPYAASSPKLVQQLRLSQFEEGSY